MPTEEDVRAYDERRSELERRYWGKFVVFHGGQLVGASSELGPLEAQPASAQPTGSPA